MGNSYPKHCITSDRTRIIGTITLHARLGRMSTKTYQSVAEQVLLDLLAENSHLTIIGDEDQSIYSFKHAHPVGVAEFHLVHDGTHDEHLDECRRCPTTVVDMANRLIANNRSRTSRTLRPKHGNPQGDLAVVQWRTMADEAHGIAEFIKTRINSGAVSAGQVLVLATRRKFGYAVRDALNAISTPVYSFFNEEALDGNPKKIEECSAAEAYTLLALLSNPEDRVALRCWCGFGSDSLRTGAWGRLRSHCEATGQTPWQALKAIAGEDPTLPHCGDLVSRFRELESRLAPLSGLAGPPLMDSLFPRSQHGLSL